MKACGLLQTNSDKILAANQKKKKFLESFPSFWSYKEAGSTDFFYVRPLQIKVQFGLQQASCQLASNTSLRCL